MSVRSQQMFLGNGFSPGQLTGLQLWLKADVGTWQTDALATPAAADVDRVGGWNDVSGNGRTFTQATSANRATLKLAIQNGLPVLRFNGSTEYLEGSGSTLDIAKNVGGLTIFVVCKSASSVADSRPFGFDINAAGTVRAALVRNIDSANGGKLSAAGRRLDADARFTATGGAGSYVNGTFDIEAGVFDFTGNLCTLYVNGVSRAASTTNGGGSTSNTSSVTVTVGQAQTLHFNGDVGEVLVYNRPLSFAEVTLVTDYLNRRWSVFVSGPPTSPPSGVHWWFKADAGTYQDYSRAVPATGDGDPVAAWYEWGDGGTGRVFEALTSNNRPTLRTNVLNGKPVLRFDGSDDYLGVGTALSAVIANNAFTVFVVFKPASITTNSGTTYINQAVMGDQGGYWGMYLKSAPTVHAYNYDGSDDQANVSIDTTNFHIVEMRHESGNLYIRRNGGSEASVASGNTLSMGGVVNIGRGYSGSSTFLPCDVAEILIYNTALSSIDSDAGREYLNGRYAIY